MASKQARTESEKKSTAAVKKLEAKLERTEAKAARWKDEAKRSARQLAAQTKRADKLEKKLSKARAVRPAADSSSEPPLTEGTAAPDATWTVVQLRAEGRARGLTGLSNKSKAQLLEALTASR